MNEVLEIFRIKKLCEPGEKWVRESGLTPRQLWDSCENGNWLLWYVVQIGFDKPRIGKIAAEYGRKRKEKHHNLLEDKSCDQDKKLLADIVREYIKHSEVIEARKKVKDDASR